MPINRCLLLALASSLLLAAPCSFAQYADAVLSYNPGNGFNSNYTNPAAALGSPSRQTVDPDPTYGGVFAVDPFTPPYLSNQLVSIGAGGSLTLHLSAPALNDPTHSYGASFILFGNSGFLITNGDYSGGGVTDGSLFGASGATRIEVSADNLTYYTLNPKLAPPVDGLFPSDGQGNFQKPVDPGDNGASFAGKDLSGIRALYAGSAGGAAYNLSWAQSTNGDSVPLASVNFIRIDVLSGTAQIDGVAVVPEPGPFALFLIGLMVIGLIQRRLHP
jgi:hypothetical protein